MKSLVLLLAGLSIVACSRSKPVDQQVGVRTETTPSTAMDDQDKAGTTTLTSATWVSNDSALDRIAVSRCAREVACGEVGPNPHKVDQATCVAETKPKMWSGLRNDVCPSGIKGDQLDQCLQAIQHESCNNPLATLSRLTACRTSELCGK